MRFASFFAAAALIVGVIAETPEKFQPNVTARLDVSFGTKAVTTPGLAFTKAETAKIPTIAYSGGNLTGSYLLFVIDLDVPGGAGGARRTLLHALIKDYKPAADGKTLTSTATGPTSYIGPSPPAESPKYAHKYVEILYPQPENFAVPASQSSVISGRMGFDIVKFAADAKLGAPVAANWFTVTG